MTDFAGFPQNVRVTSVPDPVLGVLLQEITDLSELKVTLRGFWLTKQKKGTVRPMHINEFLNDKVLVQGLNNYGDSTEESIRKGLFLATNRNTFLEYKEEAKNPSKVYYLINTPAHRKALIAINSNEMDVDKVFVESVEYPHPKVSEDYNIFSLYENNIGTISPMLAEQLRDAENIYSSQWLKEAFDIAVNHNVRNWAYISAILKRWSNEGRDSGKSGRYSEKDNRTSHIEEYRQIRGHFPWESRNS